MDPMRDENGRTVYETLRGQVGADSDGPAPDDMPTAVGVEPTTEADAAFPGCSEALIRHLAHQFPNRCPGLEDPDRVIWASSGAAFVVTYLRQALTVYQEEHK